MIASAKEAGSQCENLAERVRAFTDTVTALDAEIDRAVGGDAVAAKKHIRWRARRKLRKHTDEDPPIVNEAKADALVELLGLRDLAADLLSQIRSFGQSPKLARVRDWGAHRSIGVMESSFLWLEREWRRVDEATTSLANLVRQNVSTVESTREDEQAKAREGDAKTPPQTSEEAAKTPPQTSEEAAKTPPQTSEEVSQASGKVSDAADKNEEDIFPSEGLLYADKAGNG